MLISALRRRVARQGSQPLLTYYDGREGSRIELSAVTFANWVDKTANLIADLGHDDGEPIDVALTETHPAHWVTAGVAHAPHRVPGPAAAPEPGASGGQKSFRHRREPLADVGVVGVRVGAGGPVPVEVAAIVGQSGVGGGQPQDRRGPVVDGRLWRDAALARHPGVHERGRM